MISAAADAAPVSPVQVSRSKSDLHRQIFTTSRELEYFSEAELVTQTGYSKEDWWPGVLVKELVDNGLDACEQAGIAPEITVSFTGDALAVSDNGPGIPPDVVTRILDFSTRTSDKAAYVSPTRGAQGNALKTILAIPYVLNPEHAAVIRIEAQGTRHVITVSTDHIARRPRIEHLVQEIVKTEGTSIRVKLDSPSSQAQHKTPGFLQRLLLDYSIFNPHATFSLEEGEETHRFERAAAAWRKWLPCDPTSAHWYNPERLENLIASYVAAERHGSRPRTVREFVSEFRGLSSTQKQKKVVTAACLDRAYLHDLITERGQLDRSVVTRLLARMTEESAPVKPDLLGVLGEEHFHHRLKAPQKDGASFRYKRITGMDVQGLPYVVECAFIMTDRPMQRGLHIGMNWSVALNNPIQENTFELKDGGTVTGLHALLASNRISPDRDPVCLAVHLICPKFHFLDRGKGSVRL